MVINNYKHSLMGTYSEQKNQNAHRQTKTNSSELRSGKDAFAGQATH